MRLLLFVSVMAILISVSALLIVLWKHQRAEEKKKGNENDRN